MCWNVYGSQLRATVFGYVYSLSRFSDLSKLNLVSPTLITISLQTTVSNEYGHYNQGHNDYGHHDYGHWDHGRYDCGYLIMIIMIMVIMIMVIIIMVIIIMVIYGQYDNDPIGIIGLYQIMLQLLINK